MNGADASIQSEAVKKINANLGGLHEITGSDRLKDDYLWIAFLLGNAGYAINVKHVARIMVLHEIFPFEEAPAYCPGVIVDREGMISLLDLRSLFGQEDYMSAIRNKRTRLPMIIVADIVGKRRGMIVDKIISMEHFNNFTKSLPEQNSKQARYFQGMVKCNLLKSPTFVISPESFSTVEFEDSDAKIDWVGRFDIQLKTDDRSRREKRPVAFRRGRPSKPPVF